MRLSLAGDPVRCTKVEVQSPQHVTQWELDVRFVEGLYSQLESPLMLLHFV